MYTTIAGTLAALDAAVNLSKGLEATIVLMVVEEVTIHYALDQPPAAACCFRNVCKAILKELQLEEFGISLNIYFCRQQVKCLEAILAPRSVVVLGTGSLRPVAIGAAVEALKPLKPPV